jgi:hypothetical protein
MKSQNANYGQELLSKTVPSKAPTKNSFNGKQKRYPLTEFSGNHERKKRRESIRPAVSDQDNEESSPSFKARRPSNRRHQCFRCDQTFNLRSKFNDHLHTHHAGQFSDCECKHNGWCTKVFPTDEKKNEHQLKDHNPIKKMRILPCKICLKKASIHMSLYHRNLNLIRCN